MFSRLVTWTPKSLAKWEQARRLGKKRYVWKVGVLSWGLPMFLVMTPFFYIQQHGLTWPPPPGFSLTLILIYAALWAIGGFWFGSVMWSTMEKAYRRHQEESAGG